MGALGSIIWPLGKGIRPIFVKTAKPLTGQSVLSILNQLHRSKLIMLNPPIILQEVSEAPSGPQQLSRYIKRVFVGGAALAEAVGNILAHAGVELINLYGA